MNTQPCRGERHRHGGQIPWFVFDRDGTPIRREASLDDAVSWALVHYAASTVAERVAVADNDYGMVITDERGTPTSRREVRITRGDRAALLGWGL